MNRANYIIVEEARLVPKDILEGIIKPFLFSRQPPYRFKSEYKDDNDLKEESTISYITSAYYTSLYWWAYCKSAIRRMASGDETASFLAFDYLITTYHNIKTEATIRNEMADADPITVQMEYENIPSSVGGKNYFKPVMFQRNIKRAFYPQKEESFSQKKNPYGIMKSENELRFISIDVASRANKNNDLTIISCARLVPLQGRGYERNLVYIESHKGANTILQAKRIKEIFYDFEADYIVLDLQNIGISIFDSLSQAIQHDERGVVYPALTIAGREFDFIDNKLREDLETRTLGLGAIPVIFPVMASQALNSQIAVSMRSALQKRLWNFLIDDGAAEEFLIKNNKEFTLNSSDSFTTAFFLAPYVQTSLMIGEFINLDMSLVNGLIKLTEKSGLYKDRYSSVSYMNWIVSHFDKGLLKEIRETSIDQEIMSISQIF